MEAPQPSTLTSIQTIKNHEILDTAMGVMYRVTKTTNADGLGNVTSLSYNIQANGPFYVSINSSDVMLSNLTTSLTWLSNNMVALTSDTVPPQ